MRRADRKTRRRQPRRADEAGLRCAPIQPTGGCGFAYRLDSCAVPTPARAASKGCPSPKTRPKGALCADARARATTAAPCACANARANCTQRLPRATTKRWPSSQQLEPRAPRPSRGAVQDAGRFLRRVAGTAQFHQRTTRSEILRRPAGLRKPLRDKDQAVAKASEQLQNNRQRRKEYKKLHSGSMRDEKACVVKSLVVNRWHGRLRCHGGRVFTPAISRYAPMLPLPANLNMSGHAHQRPRREIVGYIFVVG